MPEQVFERQSWGKELFETSRPETLPNALADAVVFAVGHRLGRRWNETRRGTGKAGSEDPTD